MLRIRIISYGSEDFKKIFRYVPVRIRIRIHLYFDMDPDPDPGKSDTDPSESRQKKIQYRKYVKHLPVTQKTLISLSLW